MKVSKDNRQESDGGKVRHSSATDGDRVAAWVEPSEGVCVCGTPGCHDYPERAGWRSERRPGCC